MPRLHNQNSTKRGIALIFVLGTISIISFIAIEMSQRVQLSKKMIIDRRDSLKAIELARAAFRWSLFRLQMDSILDQVPPLPATNYGGKKDDLTEIQWTFPLTYPFPVATVHDENEPAPPPPTPEDGTFSSVITDESSKINLNDVGSSTIQTGTRWSGAASVLVNLLASPRFTQFFTPSSKLTILDIPRAIDDWTDYDTQVNYIRGGDEESEYKVDANYKVKNGPLYTLDELRMLSPIKAPLFDELKPFVTVYPFNARLPRLSTQPISPLGKINVNTAPVEVIAALFAQSALPSNRGRLECAQNFAKMRAGVAFRSVKQGGMEPNFMTFLQKMCGAGTGKDAKPFIDQEVMDVIDIKSSVFRIEASGFSGNIEKRIVAVVQRMPDKPKVLYWKVY